MRFKRAVLIFSISTTTKWSLFTFWLQGCTLQSTIVIGYLSKPDYGATNDLELDVPSCAFQYRHLNEELGFLCLDDNEYPLYDIENSLFYHHHSVYQMYKDVHNINTQNSVANITTLRDETYLCPSTVKYVKPVRAINSKGEWRIVLNHLRSKDDFISQTIRVELCVDPGQPCPKVPGNHLFHKFFFMTWIIRFLLAGCVISKCVQKHTYQRFLVFNPSDYYLPFAVESFKIPSSCDCYAARHIEKTWLLFLKSLLLRAFLR